MTIRPASAADHVAVLAIIRGIPTLPQWRLADLPVDPVPAAEPPVQRLLLVGEQGDHIVGFAQVSVAVGEAELEGMAVQAGTRRQGLGRSLLRACIAGARQQGARLLRLEVRCGNTAAVRLYQAEGLQRIGTRLGYYSNPTEDALLMECQL